MVFGRTYSVTASIDRVKLLTGKETSYYSMPIVFVTQHVNLKIHVVFALNNIRSSVNVTVRVRFRVYAIARVVLVCKCLHMSCACHCSCHARVKATLRSNFM